MNTQAWLGLALLLGSEIATLAGVQPFPTWNTPIGWTGFIVFADGVVFRARGHSWLRSAPGELAFMALASIPLWLVFEFFNLYLDNWHYSGLPENRWLRLGGYAWAFATIWPAILEGAELVSVWRGGRPGMGLGKPAPWPATAPRARRIAMGIAPVAIGALLLAWPIVQPSPYLAAPVFLGFILLLDPINWRLGHESLLADLHEPGVWTQRVNNLLLSGFLCGFLWEFLNYWSTARWRYTVPIMEDLKIFEMPLPGYFGFPAFALECFTMYVFVRAIFMRIPGFSAAVLKPCAPGRSSRESGPRRGRAVAL